MYLILKRKKTTMFLDSKENTSVTEIKKMIEGILKVLGKVVFKLFLRILITSIQICLKINVSF